jgi:hypothetical protein
MTDTEFLNIANLCVTKWGCCILDIDLENKVLNIDGPTEEAMIGCATEIGDILRRYEVTPDDDAPQVS